MVVADPISYIRKLYIEDLSYFNSNYKSKKNKSIINIDRYIYYRDIFIQINYLKDLIKTYSKKEVRSILI